MKTASPNETIDVQALRVGMFVHLDVGWMSHPFPLSSFRITTPAQLATIRSLGLRRVRWSPQQSEPDASRRRRAASPAVAARPAPTVAAANDDRGAGPDAADTVPNSPLAEGAAVDPAVVAATRARTESRSGSTANAKRSSAASASTPKAARASSPGPDLVATKPREARVAAESSRGRCSTR